jgi:hypothetical protein
VFGWRSAARRSGEDGDDVGSPADAITRILNGHPNSQIDDLLPWA